MAIIVGGIPITIFNKEELHQLILSNWKTQNKVLILHANANLVYLANKGCKWLQSLCKEHQTEIFCDGQSIRLAAQIFNFKVPEKIKFYYWFWDLAHLCEAHEFRLFILGSNKGTATKIVQTIKRKVKKLDIQSHHGYFDKSFNSAENNSVIERINNFKADVLLTCFGMPLQEKWLLHNYKNMNAKVFLTGGAVLDYISGNRLPAPKIFDRLYLEWLYRLIQDPFRLWKRYTVGNIMFVYYTIKYHFKKRS